MVIASSAATGSAGAGWEPGSGSDPGSGSGSELVGVSGSVPDPVAVSSPASAPAPVVAGWLEDGSLEDAAWSAEETASGSSPQATGARATITSRAARSQIGRGDEVMGGTIGSPGGRDEERRSAGRVRGPSRPGRPRCRP